MPIEEALAQVSGGGFRPAEAPPAPPKPSEAQAKPNKLGRQIDLDEEGAPAATIARPVPPQVPPRPKAGPSPFEMDSAKKAAAGQVPERVNSDLPHDAREQIHAYLTQKGLDHLADAVEHSMLTISGSELQITTAKTYKLYLEDRHFEAAVKEALGRPMRIKIVVGETRAADTPGAAPAASPVKPADDATNRALANDEVRRFREVFGGEVRKVRNLKE
jgi:hypothetical protein